MRQSPPAQTSTDPAAWIRARIAEGTLEARLRVLLVAAHEVLRRREEESRTAPAPPPVGTIDREASRAEATRAYAELVPRVCALAERLLPEGASFVVATRGDDELLSVGGRDAGHFPQDASGAWAGFYPADGEAAVRHLEELIAGGCAFLVFPSTAFWWLDHYVELAGFLAEHGSLLHRDRDSAIFDLRPRCDREVAA